MTIHQITADKINGEWHVIDVDDGGSIIAGPFSDNAAAWRWIDRHQGERERMPARRSGGVVDRTAVDTRQIELVMKTEVLKAIQAAMPQVEAILRDTYDEPGQDD